MSKIDLGNVILIGSRATPNVFMRSNIESSDFDVIMTPEQIVKLKRLVGGNRVKESSKHQGKFKFVDDDGNKFEIDATDSESNRILFDLIDSGDTDIYVDRPKNPTFENVKAVTATVNYAIKRSHAHRDVHWFKTMRDLAVLEDHAKSSVLTKKLSEFMEIRRFESDTRYNHNDAKINLAKSNEKFFAPAESMRTYVHDDLHVAVAFGSRPMFEKCKDDLSQAQIKKRLWDNLSALQKTQMAVEEISVLALERYIIPKKNEESQERNFKYAYRDLTTKMCKGWFRDFLIDNYRQICMIGNRDYIGMFEKALSEGKIRTKEEAAA